MAYQYQYTPRTDPFWTPDPVESDSEPRQSPTLTGDALTRAESRMAAITDVLDALSGPFGPVSIPHCNACANRNAANYARDNDY